MKKLFALALFLCLAVTARHRLRLLSGSSIMALVLDPTI